jgi:NADH:ubiquinone oxidoreductase subunit 5 (subunit L)/multisubunit Na+/H+ antiporter MnhA subunit
MEGPTPVSALIHAATMVTAGIFLIIRCSFIIEFSNEILIFMTYVGILTSIISGLIGFFQNDIKKIIAYSTCSQLGYMFFCCGLSGYNLSLFHLFNHAFFKALLFLSAGALIHYLCNEQDIRKMGGLLRIVPLIYISIFIGSLSLMGTPFLSGFFSKDSIVELAYAKLCNDSYFHLYFFSLLSIGLTVLYSLKLLYFSFFCSNMYFKAVVATRLHLYSSFFTIFPLFILCLCSIFTGYFFYSSFFYSSFFYNSNAGFFIKESIFTSNFNQFLQECLEHITFALPKDFPFFLVLLFCYMFFVLFFC